MSMPRLVLFVLVLGGLAALPCLFARSARSEPPGQDPAVARRAWEAALKRGQQIWNQSWGPTTKRCVECHGPGPNRMRSGRIKSYPKYDAAAGKVITAQAKLNQMIQSHALGKPLPLGSDDLTALEAYIGTIR